MKCPTCSRQMTPLFTSMVCDWCDKHKPTNDNVGFCFLDKYEPLESSGTLASIFRSQDDLILVSTCFFDISEFLPVRVMGRFSWREGFFSEFPDIVACEAVVHPDHYYRPTMNRCHITEYL